MGPLRAVLQDLTPADATGIVEKLRKGEAPRRGSQYRQVAEPAGAVVGGTKWVPSPNPVLTLTGPPLGPSAPNLDKPIPPPAPPPPPK